MKDRTLVNTQITVSLVKYLQKIRLELEDKEKSKTRNRKRITKREVCGELIKRCIIKRVA